MKFSGEILLLVLLVLAAQTAFTALYPVPPVSNIVHEMQASYRHSFVFLGDSVNATYSKADARRKSISWLLEQKIDQRVADISRGGFDMLLFRGYIRELVRQPPKPRTVLVEVNLSNFSDDGRSFFTQHQEIIFNLQGQTRWWLRVLDRPLHIFQFPCVRPAIRREEYMNRDIVWQGRVIGKQKNFESDHFMVPVVTDDLVRDNLIIRYGIPLHECNRMLEATTEAARLLRTHGQRAVFFITPVNYQRGEAYWNNAISPILQAKAARVRAAIAAGGGECIDLSFALDKTFFDTSRYPNEHLTESGRDFVAQSLADCCLTATKVDDP